MIGLLLFVMVMTMATALFCFWVTSWSKNSFSNANLELAAGMCGAIFLIATGFLLPLLGIEYQNVLSDDKLTQSAIVVFGFVMGFSLSIAGTGLALQICMEIVDDFKWAFNKKVHDKKRTNRRSVKKNGN